MPSSQELLASYFNSPSRQRNTVYAVVERATVGGIPAGELRYWSLSKRQAKDYAAAFPKLLT